MSARRSSPPETVPVKQGSERFQAERGICLFGPLDSHPAARSAIRFKGLSTANKFIRREETFGFHWITGSLFRDLLKPTRRDMRAARGKIPEAFETSSDQRTNSTEPGKLFPTSIFP